jgi:hypothetical protein
MHKSELEYLAFKNPDKQNADPFTPGVMVKCMEYMENYNLCRERRQDMGLVKGTEDCEQLQQVAIWCFKLEPKYFVEAVKAELTEGMYLDQYINKQMKFSRTAPAFKMKGRNN